MFTWLYIIYYNLFINKSYCLLYDENNNQYAMIDIFNILDLELLNIIFNKIYLINYFDKTEFIGLNHIYSSHLKDILIVIPYNYMYLTNNNFTTCDKKTKLVPYIMNINNLTFKKKINNSRFDLNNELYLKNIYNYKNNIPIYLLSNNSSEIKVNLKVNNFSKL